MVFEQESVAEVRKILEADAYYSGNVVRIDSSPWSILADIFVLEWDRNKLVIRAYSPGVPLP